MLRSFRAVVDVYERFVRRDGSVLPNPIDYAFFSSFKKKRHPKKRIVFVGRFEERKGVTALENAYAHVDAVLREDTELILCGRGPAI